MSELELFNAAIKLTGEQRAAFLDAACGQDAGLRQQMEELLRAHDESVGLLPRRTDHDPDATRWETNEAAPSTLIAGRYKLIEAIGEGGMGAVWLAEQKVPVKRKVALKLIKAGMDSKSVLARFEAERQALAMMDHPNIAKVFDGGMTDQGRPYFVMEFVKGVPLTDYCDLARLSLKERLNLFMPVCQAVQHAHQKGIIHRDLKPSNILICLYDGKPVPKVIDFGLAKAMHQSLTEQSLHTAHGMMVGTPLYMSPEQAEHNNLDVDTRTDIYSLGVILYELLTGSTPLERQQLKEAAFNEILRLIKEVEPPKPSTRLSGSASLPSIAAQRSIEPNLLKKSLIGDLDWIVMKALDKERSRRYETANGLARDVERFLNNEAVEACPPSTTYRLKKLLRRNKGPVLAASLVLLAVLVGTLAVLAVQARANANLRLVNNQLDQANRELKSTNTLLDQQRLRAEEREQQAIDAVKGFGDAVSNNEELKNNPSLESLRKTLLKEPLSFFKSLRDRLQADQDTRPESLAHLASASFDLGKLTSEIGDKQDALIAIRESLVIQQKLADANPADSQYQSSLAISYNDLGNLLNATGKPGEALTAHQSALAIRQKLADAKPTVTSVQSGLATSHHNLGLLHSATGKPLEALQANEAALAIFQKLADAYPTVTSFQRNLAASHRNIGNVLRATGNPFEALQAHESALTIIQKLADANPSVTSFQSDLAASHLNIGNVLRATGRQAEALTAFKSALAIRQKLADANPAVTSFQSDLAQSYHNIGVLQSETDKPAEALTAYESALAIEKKLADANPTVTTFQFSMASSHLSLGNLLRDTSKPAEALTAYQSALAIIQKLADANPNVTNFQSGLALSHQNIGNLLKTTGKPREALKAYETALAIQKKLADANPTVPQYQSDLAATHQNVGILLSTIGKSLEALLAYQQALAILEQLVQEHPTVTDYQSTLGGTLNNLAKLDLDAKRFAEARDRLLTATVWQKRVLAVNSADPTCRQFLKNHYTNLLKAAAGLGDSALAEETRRALAELAASDPSVVALDQRMTAVLGGEAAKDAAELLAMGLRAYNTRRFALAASWIGEALEREPALAEDRRNQPAYNAACCAALAGTGQGHDDPPPDEATREQLRGQVLTWLQAELDRWENFLKTATPEQRQLVATTLKHWQTDSDLASIRDSAELAKLSEAERFAFESLWKQVAELLDRAAGNTSTGDTP